MAVLAFAAIGSAIGGAIAPGAILGGALGASLTGASIGSFIGKLIGGYVDAWLFAPSPKDQYGPRLESMRITSSTEGTPIPRVYGRIRTGGNLIWATDFKEVKNKEKVGGGKGGGGGSAKVTTYTYFCSFAVAVCDGPIGGITRIWCDSEYLDLSSVNYRVYYGTDDQFPDPLIESYMGVGETPAYRNTAYIVFENMPLANYGNRIPQVEVEIVNPLSNSRSAEGMIESVVIAPAHGSFAYSVTTKVTVTSDADNLDLPTGVVVGKTRNTLNVTPNGITHFKQTLNNLLAACPKLKNITLTIPWFCDDLRAGSTRVYPGMDRPTVATDVLWSVDGLDRTEAPAISFVSGDPAYGSTPSDRSVLEAIKECKRLDLEVTLMPILVMDIPSGNTKNNPYSNSAAAVGQPAYPPARMITCSPAAGYTGTVDKTSGATTQIDAFFGSASSGDFNVSVPDKYVVWTGGSSSSLLRYRRFILHYAKLATIETVQGFLIGSGLKGLTQVRRNSDTYVAVERLVTLAADVRAILGASPKIGYAADWDEYSNHRPNDGSDDLFFHLDPLWASSDIDFVGINNFAPLSDWRDGDAHKDAAFGTVYNKAYLAGNVMGGEHYAWEYLSDPDRASQTRTVINDTDGANEDWAFRHKDFYGWWFTPHRNRPGGVRSATVTAWVPESKPIRFTAMGCPAVDRGTNKPSVVTDYLSDLNVAPPYSRGWSDNDIQRQYIKAQYSIWQSALTNPTSSIYLTPMVDISHSSVWGWDARPYPDFPVLSDYWNDIANWTFGTSLQGRIGGLDVEGIMFQLASDAGIPTGSIVTTGVYGQIEGYGLSSPESSAQTISSVARFYMLDAYEYGGQIYFQARDNKAVITVYSDDLLWNEDQDGPAYKLEVLPKEDAPTLLSWSAQRADGDYSSAMVDSVYRAGHRENRASETFPFAVHPSNLYKRSRVYHYNAWASLQSVSLGLPPEYTLLEPASLIRFALPNEIDADYIVGRIDMQKTAEIVGTSFNKGVFDVPTVDSVFSAELPAYSTDDSLPMVGLLDLPTVFTDQEDYSIHAFGYVEPFGSGLAVVQDASVVGLIDSQASVGGLLETLPSAEEALTLEQSILFTMKGTAPATQASPDYLAGANLFLVVDNVGAIEIFMARDITLVTAETFRATGLVRGLYGTDQRAKSSFPVNSLILRVDSALFEHSLTLDQAGDVVTLLIGPNGGDVADETFRSVSITPELRAVIPFAPALQYHPRTVRTTDDITIDWVRRDRALDADSWNRNWNAVPMSELIEEYELEIKTAGGSVLRTVTLNSSLYTYLAADQITDFGSVIARNGSLRVTIYQMSAIVGRGIPLDVTLKV